MGRDGKGTATNTTGADKAEANNISMSFSIKISCKLYNVFFSTSDSNFSYFENIDPVVVSWMQISGPTSSRDGRAESWIQCVYLLIQNRRKRFRKRRILSLKLT